MIVKANRYSPASSNYNILTQISLKSMKYLHRYKQRDRVAATSYLENVPGGKYPPKF